MSPDPSDILIAAETALSSGDRDGAFRIAEDLRFVVELSADDLRRHAELIFELRHSGIAPWA